MPLIACPSCGEDEDLRGIQEADRTLTTCEKCGHRWDRDLRPTCGLCGSDDLEAVPTSTLEEAGRGNQRTPSGIRDAYRCWSCGATEATSNNPVPGEPDWLERRTRYAIRGWRGRGSG